MRTVHELEQALANAMIGGPSYIGDLNDPDERALCEQEHRDALDQLTEELRQARRQEQM
jgi:hypothetical protein